MELLGVGMDDVELAERLAGESGSSRAERFDRLITLARERGALAGEVSRAQLQNLFSVLQANILAGFEYRPHAYSGEVVLMRCEERMPERLLRMHTLVGSAHDDPKNGWGEYCSALRIVPVHADHLSIVFEPHVAAVAALLRDLLDARPAIASITAAE
jgi:thioesterase domain-containing protein